MSKIISITISLIIIGLLGSFILPRILHDETDREFREIFTTIELGTNESNVVQILGVPDAKEESFRLGQMKGFEDAYRRAEMANATHYLLWFRGIDLVYSIGFDQRRIVILKESGGT